MLRLLQLTPEFPPHSGGVGDYANLLAGRLLEAHDVASSFVICREGGQAAPGDDLFPKRYLAHRNANALFSLLSSMAPDHDALLVHYSGYGYAKRGAPLWLTFALRRLRSSAPRLNIGVMFHELFSMGPVWTSSFWTSALQRSVIRRIAEIADFAVTNRQDYAQWLASQTGLEKNKISTMPVFSNLGERPDALPPSQRPARMVLYSGEGMPLAAWTRFCKHLKEFVRMTSLEEIVVMGRHPQQLPSDTAPIVRHAGFLSPAEASDLFATAKAGFFDYGPAYLAKSGIFAAFAAHGVVEILHQSAECSTDGLEQGRHFLAAETVTRESCSNGSWDRIAANASTWYKPHSIQATTAHYARLLTPLS